MQPVKVTSPWNHIGIDFVSISPTSQHGNRYVLTICDYMTTFVQAVALPTKEAPAVAAALYKVTESNVALAIFQSILLYARSL